MRARTAIIAGAGRLPATLARALPEALICAPAGIAPEGLSVAQPFHFERLVPFLRDLGNRGIETVVMAGAIERPSLDPALFDRDTAQLVPDLLRAIQSGDDGALRWVIGLMEEFDLRVEGVPQIAPDLLIADGPATARAPSAGEAADAARGAEILAALAPVDVGQGCVICAGQAIGLETLYGTDAMLADVANHRPERAPHKGGTFVKRAKAGQDLRVDLPTIGPATIEAAAQAGLTAIALQQGHVNVLDRDAVLARADAAGIALWGMA